MIPLAKAYEDLKGDLSNCHDFNAKNDRFLYLHQGGNYCTFDFKNTGSLLTYISTVEDFINFKGDNIKAVIDWSKAPEGATHYDVSPDVYPWIKEDDNGNKFYYHNEWVNYIRLISERDCHIRRPMLINCTSNNEPQPTTYTQEMSDNGVLPSVGMKCRVVTNTVTIGYVGNNFLVLVFPDGSDGTITHKEALEDLKPLTPPITLIDGKAYQFDSESVGNCGIYSDEDGLFHGTGNETVKFKDCTNIQPLTVEVK